MGILIYQVYLSYHWQEPLRSFYPRRRRKDWFITIPIPETGNAGTRFKHWDMIMMGKSLPFPDDNASTSVDPSISLFTQLTGSVKGKTSGLSIQWSPISCDHNLR